MQLGSAPDSGAVDRAFAVHLVRAKPVRPEGALNSSRVGCAPHALQLHRSVEQVAKRISVASIPLPLLDLPLSPRRIICNRCEIFL